MARFNWLRGLSVSSLLAIAPTVVMAAPQLLEPVPAAQLPARLGLDRQIWRRSGQTGDWAALLAAIDHSLRYLSTPAATEAYQQYSLPGITRERTRRSLQRFRQLVVDSPSPEALQAAVRQEFVFYRSVGKDGEGTVEFTGYFEPVHRASRVPTAEYRYPLFRRPSNLAAWPKPHPKRLELEGVDGLQIDESRLRGLELVWLRDRLEAYLVQVQGSARLQLTDGRMMTIGYGGRTDYSYTSIGKELVKDGKIRLEDLTLPTLITYFRQHPTELSAYLPRNHRFVFFKETHGSPAIGTLGVPVTPERSIATDKSILPAGALALVQTQLPYANTAGELELQTVSRYVLNQDTGGAIQGPGRVDIFMGTGKQAGDRAGLVNAKGQLYYLMLRDPAS